jgi:hypothetical protein
LDQFVGGREERFRRLDAERPRRQAGGIPHLQQRSLGLRNIAGLAARLPSGVIHFFGTRNVLS